MRLPCEAMSRAIYAFWQRYLCFLSNVFLLTIKCQYDYYQISEINNPCVVVLNSI